MLGRYIEIQNGKGSSVPSTFDFRVAENRQEFRFVRQFTKVLTTSATFPTLKLNLDKAPAVAESFAS